MSIEEQIGMKIRNLRNQNGLTQEELADRTELTKGFISQLERGLTAPSVSTLLDIVECLGTNLSDFFHDEDDLQIVFPKEDYFEKEDEETKSRIEWVVPNAQKNAMEPLRLTLQPGGTSPVHSPHEGEEFGYVLKGSVKIYYGPRSFVVRQGESFYFKSGKKHYIEAYGSRAATLIWVANPPSF